jgi:hypothetical protein
LDSKEGDEMSDGPPATMGEDERNHVGGREGRRIQRQGGGRKPRPKVKGRMVSESRGGM